MAPSKLTLYPTQGQYLTQSHAMLVNYKHPQEILKEAPKN